MSETPNIEALFPDPWNADTWNLAAISPLVRTYNIGIGDYTTHDRRPQYGAWAQDDWQITSRLTLNLGLRYDLSVNAQGNDYAVPPFVDGDRPNDTNNVQPRLGFAYQLTDKTVLRGGAGKYYAEVITPVVLYALEPATIAVLEVANDGPSLLELA